MHCPEKTKSLNPVTGIISPTVIILRKLNAKIISRIFPKFTIVPLEETITLKITYTDVLTFIHVGGGGTFLLCSHK